MKKGKFKIFLLMLLALAMCASVFAACDGNKGADSLEIATKPFKLSYNLGETLDLTGMVVKHKLADGTVKTVTDYTVSAVDMSEAGEKTVTVTYSGASASFKITVLAEATFVSLDMQELPTKTKYFVDEPLSLAGMVLKAVMSDGTSRILAAADYTVSAVDTATTGDKTVTVSYGGQSVNFSISVNCGVFFNSVTEEESKFLFENSGSQAWDVHRSADFSAGSDPVLGGYFTYCFNAGSKIKTALLEVSYRFRSTVEVSFDNQTFTPVLQSVAIDQTVFQAQFNLVTLLSGESNKINFDDNAGVIYVRFRSSSTEDGFGADIYNTGIYYTLEDITKIKPVSGNPFDSMRSFEFAPKGEDGNEAKFLYNDLNSGFFDYTEEHNELNSLHARIITAAEGYFVYAFDVKSTITDLVFVLDVLHRTQAEVSLDGKTYTQKFTQTKIGAHTTAIIKAKDLPGFAANTGKIYIRITSSVKEAAFGATLINLNMYFTLANDSLYTDPIPVPYVDPTLHLSFKPADEVAETYLYKNVGSKMWADAPNFRYCDGAGSYFIYAMDFGGALTSGELKIKVAQKYQNVFVSFDGATYTQIRAVSDGSGDPVTVPYNLSEIAGFSSNDGKLFVKFAGDDTDPAFGCILHEMYISYLRADGLEPDSVGGVENTNADKQPVEIMANKGFTAYTA